MNDPTKPYYDLPLLPPEQPLDSLELYKELVPASEALARLSATALHLPNQAALYQSVVLLEAKASSEIEQIVTTDRELFASGSSKKAANLMTKEVLRYGEAIHHGWQSERPLCTPLIEEICTIIKDREMPIRRVPGTALKRPSTGEIIYTPPDGGVLLRNLLDNLFSWMNEGNQVHPIVKSAIAHYQFESIHPFTDGNGRTGRIMAVLYLVEQGLLNAPVLFLSGEILKGREEYYTLLQSTRDSGDFVPYLLWFIGIVRRASVQSTDRANRVKREMQKAKQILRDQSPSIYSQNLVNVLFSGPLIFAHELVDHGIAGSLSTAHAYLKELEKMGLVMRLNERYERKVGFTFVGLLDALSGEIDLS